jgi:hypothetical protein
VGWGHVACFRKQTQKAFLFHKSPVVPRLLLSGY